MTRPDGSPRGRSLPILLVAVFLIGARPASADWMFTPFVGSSFGSETAFVLAETGAAKAKLIVGGSAALLSRGVFGLEADFGYVPRFFERDPRAGDISGSNVTTLSGNLIVAVPLAVTRESLRPYVVGGLGLVHAAAQTTQNVLDINENLLGYNIGGGAFGLISPRTGFRFELRHFQSVENSPNLLTETVPRLSFWRATVGVVIRVAN